MNNVAYFEIQVDKPEAAIKFYTDIFGWKFFRDKILPIAYWQIQMDGINGGLLKRPASVSPSQSGTNAFVCSMQVEDFGKTAEKICSSGGQVALPKFAIPGRRYQGYFLDLDGNTFGIFQVDEHAKSKQKIRRRDHKYTGRGPCSVF